MKKIIYLILFNLLIINIGLSQNNTYIYRNYSNSIIRAPYPSYVVQGQYIYRVYTNSIIRTPYPQYTIKNNYLYRNYSNSIIRKPYPLGTFDGNLPD